MLIFDILEFWKSLCSIVYMASFLSKFLDQLSVNKSWEHDGTWDIVGYEMVSVCLLVDSWQ